MKRMRMVAIMVAFVSISPTFGGHENGHGGDQRAVAFVSIAQELIADLRSRPIGKIDVTKLAIAVNRTRIRTTQDDLFDVISGANVDAINHPRGNPPQIVINRSAWDRIPGAFEKRRLVLHEYLSIIGMNDENYRYSSLIDRAEVCRRHPVIRRAIENALSGIACDRVTSVDLANLKSLAIQGSSSGANSEDNLKPIDFSGLNLEKVSFRFEKMPPRTEVWRDRLSSVTAVWTGDVSSTLSDKAFQGFKRLRKLELTTHSDIPSGFFRPLTQLDELLLVSPASGPVRIPKGAFSGLEASPLRRVVFCDITERRDQGFVNVPNFQVEDESFVGLAKVREATLCLNLGNYSLGGSGKKLGPELLRPMRGLTHLWLKVDDWSALKNDFFSELPAGTCVAFIPSGRLFKKGEFDRFAGVDCGRGWDWSKEKFHRPVIGKTYCLKK